MGADFSGFRFAARCKSFEGVHTSWATVREALKTHQANTIVLPTEGGLVLRIRKGTTPEPAHRKLYAKLGIEPEVIRPRKTWTRDEAPKQ